MMKFMGHGDQHEHHHAANAEEIQPPGVAPSHELAQK
jgi:hypothetical protein